MLFSRLSQELRQNGSFHETYIRFMRLILGLLWPWWSARRKCRALGGDLVCVETPNEHQFLCQFALAQFGNPDRFYVWLGATEEGHEGVYTWVSGSPVMFNAWAPNYPSKNVVGGAIFLAREAGGGARFHWMDTVPTQKYCYICEWSR